MLVFKFKIKSRYACKLHMTKFTWNFQVAGGGIEPQFYKELCRLQHKLCTKTYTRQKTPTPPTQKVAAKTRCCILINNKSKMPSSAQAVTT